MRILVAAAAALVMLGGVSANAQSLEQTYADLCSDPAKAKSESCVALAQALVAKLQGQGAAAASGADPAPGAATPVQAPDAATLALWRKRWGLMLDQMGGEWFGAAWFGDSPPGTAEAQLQSLGSYTTSLEWKVPGLEMVTKMKSPDGTVTEWGVTRWDESRQRLVANAFGHETNLIAQPDGSLLSPEATTALGTHRALSQRMADGTIQTTTEKKEAGVWVTLSIGESMPLSPVNLEHMRQRIRSREQQRLLAAQEQQRLARAEKADRSAQRGAMFGAVLQGLAQGMAEVNTGGYAQAQANLDATVANIQHAAAAERWAQAPAQQQAPARAVDYRTEAAERATQQLPERSFIASSAPSSNSAATHSDVSAGPPNSSGPVEMFVFFVNLGGKTVAFEGPLALSRAEGSAMKTRLEGEAPSRYGAGASVDARSRGGGWCAFVYQRPGDERYIMGSETTLSTATNSMKGMVNNLNAVIHHDVVCP